MRINEDAIVLVRREVLVPATPEEVWGILADVPGWPRWMPAVGFTALPEPPKVGTRFQWKVNGMHTVSHFEVFEPGRRIGWSNRGFGVHGGHLWTLSEKGTDADGVPAGQPLTRVESTEVANGWVTWLLRRTVRKTLELSADLWVESLAARVEAGRG